MHLHRLVGGQVVHNQHGVGLALAQRGQPHLFKISGEDGAVGGRLDAHRRDEAVHANGAKHAQPLPVPEQDAGTRPLAA